MVEVVLHLNSLRIEFWLRICFWTWFFDNWIRFDWFLNFFLNSIAFNIQHRFIRFFSTTVLIFFLNLIRCSKADTGETVGAGRTTGASSGSALFSGATTSGGVTNGATGESAEEEGGSRGGVELNAFIAAFVKTIGFPVVLIGLATAELALNSSRIERSSIDDTLFLADAGGENSFSVTEDVSGFDEVVAVEVDDVVLFRGLGEIRGSVSEIEERFVDEIDVFGDKIFGDRIFGEIIFGDKILGDWSGVTAGVTTHVDAVVDGIDGGARNRCCSVSLASPLEDSDFLSSSSSPSSSSDDSMSTRLCKVYRNN
ncbi:hypothetical protein GCK72_005297 [Caenorhabditis remanei]|uniref:Uncharacterized protein n=1 Tax=Caenorhabditis remanei TaxID=31234 RepID=A0A6A5HDF7_CAERE|nr:hypothetical protein GCK72_005297 [Caenorhabditis remanei]KAF1765345.1 hypothetical protein GCK72_005297 [Caenorhabditis remanei]